MPPTETTRWQGTKSEKRFSAQKVPAARAARGAPGERGELAVADDLAPGHGAQRRGERGLERRRPVLVERNVRERDPLAREIAVQTPEQIRHEAVGLP